MRDGLSVAGAVVALTCSVPAQAAEPWVGRWAATSAVCSGFGGSSPATAALVVNDNSLNWYSGHCRIGKMYKLGQTAYIEARCSDSNGVPVTLEPRGDKLRVTWNRGKAEDLQRCK